jgi:hypothetical protein
MIGNVLNNSGKYGFNSLSCLVIPMIIIFNENNE